MTKRQKLIEEILHSFHAIRNITKAMAVGLGHQKFLAHSRWFVLMMIEHFKNRSIKDIANAMEISSSAATQLVDAPVHAGFVVREEGTKDRRLVQLRLSAKGKKHIASMKEKRIAEMEGLFDSLTDTDLEEL